jgi:hypothetical protein
MYSHINSKLSNNKKTVTMLQFLSFNFRNGAEERI